MLNWWKNRNVLVTGHTGFKGAWLCLWLEKLGANVTAAALEPDTKPSLYDLTKPWDTQNHHIIDIRDTDAIGTLIEETKPEIVLHLAGQALVRRSYREPIETYATNVMGTVHVLDAIRLTKSVKAALMITTDKVYENAETGTAFVEGDRLGGHDPYSNSKACAELAVQAYRDSFFTAADAPVVATVRAGNVVGGGDWSEDRLIPDIVRAYESNSALEIRHPEAVRPWQHTLDALYGYMLYVQALMDRPANTSLALNFGPNPDAFLTVRQVVDAFSDAFGKDLLDAQSQADHPHEAKLLTLDTQLAQKSLNWQLQLEAYDAIAWTADWYKQYLDGADARSLTLNQIETFERKLSHLKEDAA